MEGKASNHTVRIGLALSGGGHRATLFALGVLLYLSDAGKLKDVASVSSVSGNSITNAFLRMAPEPFNRMTSSEFERYAARLARQIAGRPSLLWLSLSAYFVAALIVVADFLFSWHIGTRFPLWAIAVALFPLLVSVLLGPHSLGTLWSWWGLWAYVGLIFAIFLLSIWLVLPVLVRGIGICIALGSLIFRPIVAGIAIGYGLEKCSDNMKPRAKRKGKAALLHAAEREVVHAFCATDMHDGEHVWFCTNDVVYSPSFGIGDAGDLKLRAAVEASANFPVLFPPRLMWAKRHNFRNARLVSERRRTGTVYDKWPSPFSTMVLTDGGVRDNTALSWHLERQEVINGLQCEAEKARDLVRQAHERNLEPPEFSKNAAEMLEPVARLSSGIADEVIAVNGAYTPAGSIVRFSWLPALGELFIIGRLPSVFYQRTNRHRVEEFRRSVFLGNTRGALISIEFVATSLASYITRDATPLNFPPREAFDLSSFESRAQEVVESEDAIVAASLSGPQAKPDEGRSIERTARYFHEIVRACRDEGTHLNPTGAYTAAKLLCHGYMTAMAQLRILDETYPLVQNPSSLSEFCELAAGRCRRQQ